MDYGYDAPFYWSEALKADPHSYLSADFCMIEKRDYFVRGLLEVPVLDSVRPFRWGVWVSLSKPNFDKMVSLWHDPKLVEEPSYFGWLSSSIEMYPPTLNLKTSAHSTSVHERPQVILEQSDHPLAVEQSKGISVNRVREIVERALHG